MTDVLQRMRRLSKRIAFMHNEEALLKQQLRKLRCYYGNRFSTTQLLQDRAATTPPHARPTGSSNSSCGGGILPDSAGLCSRSSSQLLNAQRHAPQQACYTGYLSGRGVNKAAGRSSYSAYGHHRGPLLSVLAHTPSFLLDVGSASAEQTRSLPANHSMSNCNSPLCPNIVINNNNSSDTVMCIRHSRRDVDEVMRERNFQNIEF
ncbi:hypothetical protein STCU_10711 [Strigomonas culicis]|uniref:Uncharacterized protein n=1 Tax=Strigomonas culicis TaxID=28005 RepID=S9URQ0_9TRYP|nr:hypothetical protein STCU_10711 [Strigomonas culicis]|eukprot:EPY17276.1 hypothetical protein STCU_10711 [Strigomonas culicis]